MPEEPVDPTKQSVGDGFQNLVPQPGKTPRGVWVIVGLAAFFVVVAFGISAYIVFHAVSESRRHDQSIVTEASNRESVTPASTVGSAQSGSPIVTASTKPTGVSNQATQGATPVASDANDQDATRKAVLTRIDLMHNLSEKEKDELYAQVERARGFEKVAIVQFQTGRSAPVSTQIDEVIKRLQDPDLQKLLSDPTVLLIFVGYADTQGNEAANLEISRARAETVQKLVSSRLKLANLMHSVGMGGQELFDKTNREKNRVVEVWAVQP